MRDLRSETFDKYSQYSRPEICDMFMGYSRPEIFDISLENRNQHRREFGTDTNSGCGVSCCYAQGSDW
ncbi:hypothetical protein [Acetobacterium wieringae]|uniref:hypothetical protein n=1 Tax=Acetobacterium wieringae TaxID=52694 RepID=UPI0026F0EBEF|nr:hypothetical protein [Acetobacterium wieringae]